MNRKRKYFIALGCAAVLFAVSCLFLNSIQSDEAVLPIGSVIPVETETADFDGASNQLLEEQKARLIVVNHFHANQLNNDRSLHIYLPPGYYTDPEKKFPVLYVQDGKSVFDLSDWSQESLNMHITADRLISEKKMDEIIIVGIDNIGEDRLSEYAHWDGVEGGETVKGKGLLYEDFVINDVKPFIDKNFRTLPDCENTALMGASIGGFVTFNIGFRHPEVFSKLAMLSPYLGWGDGKLYEELRNGAYQEKRPLKMWIDVGSVEYYFIPMVDVGVTALMRNGYRWGDEMTVYEAPGGEHSERFWAERVESVLLYLFGDIGNPQEIKLYMEPEISISKMAYGNINAVMLYDSGFKMMDVEGKYKVEKPELLLVGTYGAMRPLAEGTTKIFFQSSAGLEASGSVTIVE